ncbi:MAG: IF-2-associated domain-containing protein, partial [Rhodospirillaceae bacterium]|nr:IF-2-associated domain-containing protein [Rhodospirillaceae bacterium]
MSDSTDTDKKKKPSGKPLGLSRPGKLELKKTVESGSVRQSFSHGRSKMVQVEVKKKRTYKTNSTGSMAEIKDVPKMPEIAEAPPKEPEAPQVPSSLTNEERAARARALQDAKTGDDKAEKMPPPPPRPEPKSEVTKPEPEAPVVDEEAKRQAEEEDKAVASAAAEKL